MARHCAAMRARRTCRDVCSGPGRRQSAGTGADAPKRALPLPAARPPRCRLLRPAGTAGASKCWTRGPRAGAASTVGVTRRRAIPGERMFGPHVGGTFDLCHGIPSLAAPDLSLAEGIHAFTRRRASRISTASPRTPECAGGYALDPMRDSGTACRAMINCSDRETLAERLFHLPPDAASTPRVIGAVTCMRCARSSPTRPVRGVDCASATPVSCPGTAPARFPDPPSIQLPA